MPACLLWPALDNSIEGSELGTPIRSRCGRCCGKCFTAQRRRCRFHIMWHRHIAMHHSAVVEVPQHTHPPEVHVLWPAMMAEAEGGGRTRAHSPGPKHPEPADVAARDHTDGTVWQWWMVFRTSTDSLAAEAGAPEPTRLVSQSTVVESSSYLPGI